MSKNKSYSYIYLNTLTKADGLLDIKVCAYNIHHGKLRKFTLLDKLCIFTHNCGKSPEQLSLWEEHNMFHSISKLSFIKFQTVTQNCYLNSNYYVIT